MLIGLISDTHGLVRPQALEALAGVEMILHAGDVGSPRVLEELSGVAPVHAVLGNVDGFELALPALMDLTLGGVKVHVSHGNEAGSPTPEKLVKRYAADVIVFGHTHEALIERVGDTLVVNPGSAGPRRFRLEPSVALLRIEKRKAHAEIVWLEV